LGNLSEEKKDLFCAAFRIDREGNPLENKNSKGLNGLDGFETKNVGNIFIS